MKINITMQQSSSRNTPPLQRAQRVAHVLKRFSTSIQAVKICITDTNGPKGGIDTRCVVAVKLASVGEIIVQGEGKNITSILNHCLSRANRSIIRRLERRRDTPIRMNRRKTAGTGKFPPINRPACNIFLSENRL